MTNPDSILKSKDITFLTKVYIVKATDFFWIFIGRTDAEAEAPIPWSPDVKSRLIRKDHDVEKDWRQEEKGDDRGWDGWMASLIQWTWIWATSRRWWRTGKPGMLESMASQRVEHNWVSDWTKQQHSLLFIQIGIYHSVCCSFTNNLRVLGFWIDKRSWACLFHFKAHSFVFPGSCTSLWKLLYWVTREELMHVKYLWENGSFTTFLMLLSPFLCSYTFRCPHGQFSLPPTPF